MDEQQEKETVYLAAPVAAYATERMQQAEAHLKRLFPDAEVMSARNLYTDNDDWRRRWPELCSQVTMLVFIDAYDSLYHDHYIGRGVFTEILDVREKDAPVFYLTVTGNLVPLYQVKLRLISRRRNGGWIRHSSIEIPEQAV